MIKVCNKHTWTQMSSPLSPLQFQTDLQRQFKSGGSGFLWKVSVVSMVTELYFGRKKKSSVLVKKKKKKKAASDVLPLTCFDCWLRTKMSWREMNGIQEHFFPGVTPASGVEGGAVPSPALRGTSFLLCLHHFSPPNTLMASTQLNVLFWHDLPFSFNTQSCLFSVFQENYRKRKTTPASDVCTRDVSFSPSCWCQRGGGGGGRGCESDWF